MAVLAWLGAAAIGVSLGLFGSGGSILTVPVLVYLFGQDEKTAIAGSLLVVGAVALAGALGKWRERQIHWPSVALFGLPGMLGTWWGSWLSHWLSGNAQMQLFAVVMLAAGLFMLRGPAGDDAPRSPAGRSAVAAGGAATGVLTGLVGVGGGFLIVPGLTLAGGLDIRRATGTSLAIIVLNSLTGFWKHFDLLAGQGGTLPWGLIGGVAAIGAAGSMAGNRLGGRLRAASLRRGFALFLLLLAAGILISPHLGHDGRGPAASPVAGAGPLG